MSARAQNTREASVVRAAAMNGQGLSRLAPSPALTSLVVGPANDEFEREADRSAEYVMSIRGLGAPALPSPPPPHSKRGAGSVQRACACGGKAEGEGECEECAKARLQRKAMDGPDSGRAAGHSPAHAPAHAPPMVHDVLRSPGRALDAGVRAFMEPRFGHDFGSVRDYTPVKPGAPFRAIRKRAWPTADEATRSSSTKANTSPRGEAGAPPAGCTNWLTSFSNRGQYDAARASLHHARGVRSRRQREPVAAFTAESSGFLKKSFSWTRP